ncbi:MAG: hypothetical protein AABW61_03270 [Candidatus Aenigmatarchaeota archaeon]
MKEYKSASQHLQKLDDVNPVSKYFRYAQSLGRNLLSALGYTGENRDPYHYSRTHRPENSGYGNFIIPLGAGYPELKPVGSRI